MSPDVDCHSDRFQKLLKKSSTFSFDTSLFCCPQITHSHTHARKCEHTLTVHINTQTEMHARTCKLRTHYALHVNVLCPCGFHSSLQTEIPALLLTQLFLDACVRSLAQLLTRLQYRRSPNTLGSVFTLLLINSHQSGCMPLHKQCNILINTFPLLFSFIWYTNRSSRFAPPVAQLNPRIVSVSFWPWLIVPKEMAAIPLVFPSICHKMSLLGLGWQKRNYLARSLHWFLLWV